MQVYNRVLVSENVPTLVLLDRSSSALRSSPWPRSTVVRAQLRIRCGVRLDMACSRAVSSRRLSPLGAARLLPRRPAVARVRPVPHLRDRPGIYFAFDLPWIPIYLLLLFFIDPILGTVATLGAAVHAGPCRPERSCLTHAPLKAAEDAGNRALRFTENILRHADVVRAMGMQPAVERHWETTVDRSCSCEQARASDKNAVISSTIRFARLLLQSLMLWNRRLARDRPLIIPATIFRRQHHHGPGSGSGRAGGRRPGSSSRRRATAFADVRGAARRRSAEQTRTDRAAGRATPCARGCHVTRCILPPQRRRSSRTSRSTLPAARRSASSGPSGSGKSTLARLLVGAIAPEDGKLRFGGVDYSALGSARIRPPRRLSAAGCRPVRRDDPRKHLPLRRRLDRGGDRCLQVGRHPRR